MRKSLLNAAFGHQDYTPVVMHKVSAKNQKGRIRHKASNTDRATRHLETTSDVVPMKTFPHDFIQRVQKARMSQGMKQRALEARLALPKNTIRDLEAHKLPYSGHLKERLSNWLQKLSNQGRNKK